MNNPKKINIYTDGACKGNPGQGGWGAILDYEGHIKEISGYSPNTTNNIMELTAVIKALEALKSSCQVVLTTDSKYVKNGITDWIHNWKKNGWKTANKKEVKNKELWTELDNLSNKFKIEWSWVKAHSTDLLNNEVDILAREIAKNY